MVGADAGGEIAVEGHSAQQRGMAVDVPTGERVELRQEARILGQHARKVHHLGQPEGRGMGAQRQQVGQLQPGAGGLQLGRPARTS